MSLLIQLRRNYTNTPWGFRMNGGYEYGQPLYIQKVNAHSLAHKSGLRPGDGILQIGQTPTHGILHETAKMEIIRAGNEVDFVIQRNLVPVATHDELCAAPAEVQAPYSPRAEVMEEPIHWRGGPPQNPDLQSRSFKIIQQQLAAE